MLRILHSSLRETKRMRTARLAIQAQGRHNKQHGKINMAKEPTRPEAAQSSTLMPRSRPQAPPACNLLLMTYHERAAIPAVNNSQQPPRRPKAAPNTHRVTFAKLCNSCSICERKPLMHKRSADIPWILCNVTDALLG